MAGHVAKKYGLTVVEHPADWQRYGKRAGMVRNGELLDTEPDLVIGFWLDESRGTGHCLKLADAMGIPLEVHRRFTPPSPPKKKGTGNMTSLPNIDPQQLATIVAAVMASLGTVPQTAVYDETDIEGKPLKTVGHGVREIKQMASCKTCGTGNVAWVQSTKAVYPEGHPKAGQFKWYLAQAYRTKDDKLIALAFQRHSQFCPGADTPDTTTQTSPTAEAEEAEAKVNSVDDALEEARQEPEPFDNTPASEVDEAGEDLPLGLLLDLDNITNSTVGQKRTIAQRLREAGDAIEDLAEAEENPQDWVM